MSNSIPANLIKTKGVSAFDETISNEGELFISVHGKNKFVVLSIEKYNYLRECELETALLEAKKDLKNGNFNIESVEKHIERIKNG
jgi:hypothetical protein